MRRARTESVDPTNQRTRGESAQTRTVLLVLVCLLVGLGVAAVWYYRAANRNVTRVGGAGRDLAESTKAVLKGLAAPVEIRFYSLLDPASTSDALRTFAGRVDQLLSAYEQQAGGKIKLIRHTANSDSAAASADGIRAFNLDKGDACYLGVAVASNGQKETLSQLLPDWEAALESDLSRAIARVTAARPTKSAVLSTPKTDAAVVAEVRRAIPQLESVSLAEGTQTLRAAALKEFVEATESMQRAVQEAEQRVRETQNGGSVADQQAAVKQLRQLQAEQTEKLQRIAARLQEQIAALEKLKK